MFILRYPRSYHPWLDLENTLDSSGIYLTGLLVTQTHACILLDLGYPWDIPNLTRDILINQLILCPNCDGRVQEHSSAHCSGWTLTFLLPPSKTSSPNDKMITLFNMNMQDELGFAEREDSNKWSVSELNNILCRHLVWNRNGWTVHWEESYKPVVSTCYP